jgi:ribonuclease VapC
MADIVLDSSAILAVINREPGAAEVLAVSEGATVSTLIVAEVVSWLVLRNTPEQDVYETFEDFRFAIAPFDNARAIAAGFLVSKSRRRGLSLADRACLALAIELELPVMTGDRAWLNLNIGVDVRLFR